jgi:5'-3' exoribonuclease 1
MGVPKFFRWLSERYPLINQRVVEKNDFDCFYLDMNGIIHTCSQKFEKGVILNNHELFQKIFSYTEHLFRIVRPRKLMFLAIDGVAPRAKMNQQRSRRFRSIKEFEKNNKQNSSLDKSENLNASQFDSNCITPGTEFMNQLSISFKNWIKNKIKYDSEWQQGCDVIFSGSEVPGEGEHKIMNYIRKIQQSKDYTNRHCLKHCLYGLDADLIMLGLVAHEKNFTLLREKLSWKANEKINGELNFFKNLSAPSSDGFHLLEISLLRDMLYLEFKPREILSFNYNIERVVDDFIFMCMLIGNDFLPGLPHLDIASGGLNLLVRSYKEIQMSLNGYLTKKHQIHLGRAELFFEKISNEAEALFFLQKEEKIDSNYEGYKIRYYFSKLNFNIDTSIGFNALFNLKEDYVHGLHWCLFYYHNGCPSWNWFYPEYYSPLSSDLKNLSSIKIHFIKGRPFEPLIQLLAVLPPKSSIFLPHSFADLMINKQSPILEFYPQEYKIDLNGKKNLWEGVVLLPFINQEKLINAVQKFGRKLKLLPKEKIRNCFGKDIVFIKNFLN